MAAQGPSASRRVQRLLKQVEGGRSPAPHAGVASVARDDTATRGGASGSRRGRGRSAAGAGAGAGAGSAAPPVATLPLHSVHVTCERLLATAAPLLRDDGGVEADELETAVRLFLASDDAEKLQKHVIAARDKHPLKNFMLEWWNQSYLAGRYANPINVNPFLGFAPHVCQPNQVMMAAAMAHHTAKFIHTLQTKTRPPDMDFSGRVPLCNSQYQHMFGTMRLPRPGMDELVHHPMSRHIIVVRHQRFYRLEILDAERRPYSKESLAAQLTAIVTQDRAIAKDPEQCLGVLTSLDRDTWASLHTELRDHAPANKLFLDTLASSLFFLCMDAASPSEATPLADQFLFGGRNSWPSADAPRWPSNVDGLARWYDKCVQLIVLANGRTAFNFEHSWGDGSSLTRAFHEIAHDMNGTASGFPEILSRVGTSAVDAPAPELLSFALPPSWSAAANGSSKVPGTPAGLSVLKAAAVSMGQRVANVWVEADWWTKFGSDYIKKNWRISPDAVSQLCMQVAVRHSMRHLVPDDVGISTYEAMDMRHCAGGRTETIRVVTPESTKFVRMMLADPAPDPAELREALHQAADAHRARAQDMRVGNGIERHLFALMCAARELGVKTPPLFKAVGLRRMLTNTLSTSTLASDVINVGGFGPVEAVGFGGGYFLQPDHFYMAIATNRFRLATEADVEAGAAATVGALVPTQCSATDFMDAWRGVIQRIDDLCRSTPAPESALRHRKKGQ